MSHLTTSFPPLQASGDLEQRLTVWGRGSHGVNRNQSRSGTPEGGLCADPAWGGERRLDLGNNAADIRQISATHLDPVQTGRLPTQFWNIGRVEAVPGTGTGW